MAIGVNANVSRADINGTTATTVITKPTGTTNTDVLVVVFGTDHNTGSAPGTVTAPSGWTRVGLTSGSVAGSTGNIRLDAFWALGSVASLTFTNGATGGQQGWVCVGFTGVDNITPIDVTGTVATSTGSTTATAGAVTVATDQAWELIGMATWNGGNNSATGFTVRQNVASPPANGDATLLYNTTPKGTGSTGTVVCTSSGSATGQVIAVLPFALRPAASADVLMAQSCL